MCLIWFMVKRTAAHMLRIIVMIYIPTIVYAALSGHHLCPRRVEKM